eukprot:m.139441 g.139441  ORF g.139441 m.139441 type:complete len:415 (+) comp14799_c0_seq1:1727-2971(+)
MKYQGQNGFIHCRMYKCHNQQKQQQQQQYQQQPRQQQEQQEQLPITIITGFLGAGKTTFLKYLLQTQTEKKYVVIENEFGEESIDTMLLQQTTKMDMAEKLITLENGCMCCTVRGDIIGALKQVLGALKEGASFDGIMIETTGVADPGPICQTFMDCEDNEILTAMRLDGILTLVDAGHIIARLDDKEVATHGAVNEACQQIAFADVVILNKVDTVTPDVILTVKNRIREINMFSKVIPATMGIIDLNHISNIRTLDLSKFEEHFKPKEHTHHDDKQHTHHKHNHDHEEGHKGHDHGPGEACNHGARGVAAIASSFALERKRKEVIGQMALMKFLDNVAQSVKNGHAKHLFRCKGVVAVKRNNKKRAFQMVGESYDEEVLGEWKKGEERISKVVFIGVDLDKAYFETLMDKMMR